MPTWDRVVAMSDIPFRLHAVDAAGYEALDLLLGALPDCEGLPVGTIRAGGAGPGIPARAPDQSYEDRRVWLEGDQLTFLDATGAVARSGPRGAEIGGATRADEAAAGIRRLFLPSVGHLLAFHDRLLVHAGVVVVGGRTLLVLGPSGAGKSTLALVALDRGWPVLSDDLAVLAVTDQVISVAGVPRPPTVPTDLAVDLRGAPLMHGDPRRRAVLPASVLASGFRRVDGVLVVAHGLRPLGEHSPVSGRDVHLLLIGSFPAASHPMQLRRAHPVFSALARLPARTLFHGTDPERRLASSAAALADLSRTLAPVP